MAESARLPLPATSQGARRGRSPYPKRPRLWPAPVARVARRIHERKESAMAALEFVQWMTDEHWPTCVAIMAALVLVVAYIEGGTVMVP